MSDEPLRFDATDDHVTCEHCGAMRPVEVQQCPRCRRVASLTVERFGQVDDIEGERS